MLKQLRVSSSIIHYRLAFIFLTIGLFILFFSPLIGVFSTHTTSANDGPLVLWLIHQSANFWSGTGSLYHWPIFHPYLNTATFSDPFLTLGLLLIPVRAVTQHVVAQHNLLLLLSIFSSFVSMYLLAKYIWKTTLIAWVTAVVFCFSFLYLQFAVHLHTFFIAGLPLSLWALIKYLETKQLQHLFILAVAFLMQAFNAPMTAYLIIGVLSVYLVSEKKLLVILKDRSFLLTAFLVASACVWLYTPYLVTAEVYDAARTIRDTAHFSFPVTRLFWVDVVFPAGLLFLSLFLKKRTKSVEPLSLRTCLWIAVLGAVFMLGPVVKIDQETVKIFSLPIPLPYAVAYYSIPGLSAFRAVTRWSILLHFGLSLGMGWLLHGRKIKLRVVVTLLTIWLISMGLLFQEHVKLHFIPAEIPTIYSSLDTGAGEVLAEFPITQWDMVPFDGLENKRLLYQLKHQKKLYNGVSGFMPPKRSTEIHTHFQHFPDETSLNILATNGVDLVIIHFDEYQQMDDTDFRYAEAKSMPLAELIEKVENQERLELLACTNTPLDCLYQLR